MLCGAGSACGQQGVTQPVITPAAAPPPPPSSTAAAVMPVDSSYVIGSEDSLQVTVWKEPNLSGTLLVRPDGMITLPLVGDVTASGLTPTALGKDLTTKLKKFISDPLVTVTVVAVNSKRVYLLGEVARVGPLSLSPGLTPLQAIAEAGGLSPYAHAKDIYILRVVNGKQQKIAFNYKKALKTGDQQSVSLLPGDTIVVP